MEILLNLGSLVGEFLRQNQNIGFWIVAGASMFESLAFIGLIFPGGNLALAVGVLTAFHYLGFWTMVLASTIGAIIGDIISFYLGRWAQKFFRTEEAYIFKLSYYEKGRDFFERHGGKSVFTGRFVGPIRPVIPFIAGIFKMKFRVFNFYNMTSALLWSLLFIGAGYLGGHGWKFLNNIWLKIILFIFPILVVVIAGLLLKPKKKAVS